MTTEKLQLSAILHGDSKAGKSTLSFTAPFPLLAQDSEGSTKFINRTADGKKIRKIKWNPMNEYPPECGDWDVCVVKSVNWQIIKQTYDHLVSSKHCFRSTTLDSITDMQAKCKASLKGTEQMQQQDWGQLLAKMDELVRGTRDLCELPDNPLEVSIFMAQSVMRDGLWRPNMQGGIRDNLPYWVDMVGYVQQVAVQDANGQDNGQKTVNLISGSNNQYLAGNRFQGAIPAVIGSPISLSTIQQVVYA